MAVAAKVVRKTEYIGHRSASKAVNTLVIITNDEDISFFASQKLYQLFLDVIGILIFIYQNIPDPPGRFFPYCLFFRKNIVCLRLESCKIEKILFFGTSSSVFCFFSAWHENICR